MLENLIMKHQDARGLETVGFLHSGLQSILLRADRPTRYITRIARTPPTHISNDVINFGPSVLPSIYSAWIAREIVKRVQVTLDTPITTSSNDSSWLDTFWTRRPSIIIPKTSTSLETSRVASKRLKTNP